MNRNNSEVLENPNPYIFRAADEASNLAKLLARNIPELVPSQHSAATMEELRRDGQIGSIPKHRMVEFNQNFFIRNYFKCAYVLGKLAPIAGFSDGDVITDVGAGAGTFTLACIRNNKMIMRHRIIERSEYQIATTSRIFSHLKIPCDAQLEHREIHVGSEPMSSDSVVLASYSLGEVIAQHGISCLRVFDNAKSLLVIDHGGVVEQVAGYFRTQGKATLLDFDRLTTPSILGQFIWQEALNVSHAYIF